MRDLVRVVERMNDEAAPDATLKGVPVKEIVEIRIGAPFATLEGAKLATKTGSRYLPESRGFGDEQTRAPSLSGRYSDPDFYKVLPFRMVVVVESAEAGELIGRVKGTESFLSVEGWQMRPIVQANFGRFKGLRGETRDVYGDEDIVYLEMIGESLIFQLPGGRVTVLPKETEEAPAEG
jgi:hypothetical protein